MDLVDTAVAAGDFEVDNAWIRSQVYLYPYPREFDLRNQL